MKKIYQDKILRASWEISIRVSIWVLVTTFLIWECILRDFGLTFFVFLLGFVAETYFVYYHHLKLLNLLKNVE